MRAGVLPAESRAGTASRGCAAGFFTDIAHDFVLRVQNKNGTSVELPAMADAVRGGFVVDTQKVKATEFDTQSVATLHGRWGFESFAGPSFHMRSTQKADWKFRKRIKEALIVAREDTLHLESICAVCAEKISMTAQDGKEIKLTWKVSGTNEVEVHVPLKDAGRGENYVGGAKIWSRASR